MSAVGVSNKSYYFLDYRFALNYLAPENLKFDKGAKMTTIIRTCIILGIISLIMGLVSRLTLRPFYVEAQAYLQFGQFCFLAAITFLLYKIAFKVND